MPLAYYSCLHMTAVQGAVASWSSWLSGQSACRHMDGTASRLTALRRYADITAWLCRRGHRARPQGVHLSGVHRTCLLVQPGECCCCCCCCWLLACSYSQLLTCTFLTSIASNRCKLTAMLCCSTPAASHELQHLLACGHLAARGPCAVDPQAPSLEGSVSKNNTDWPVHGFSWIVLQVHARLQVKQPCKASPCTATICHSFSVISPMRGKGQQATTRAAADVAADCRNCTWVVTARLAY